MRLAGPVPAVAVIAVAVLGCGESLDAPRAATPASPCQAHIDVALEDTLAALQSPGFEPLAQLLESLARVDGDDPIARVLEAALALFRALAPITGEQAALPTIDLAAVRDLERGAARALETFIAPTEGTDAATDKLQVFEIAAQALSGCPEGSLTGTLRVLTSDERLGQTLSGVARDQRFIDFFSPLLDPASGDAGRRGVLTLIQTLFDLLSADPFDFASLRGVFGLIIPADEAPMVDFLDALEEALNRGGLSPVQSSLRCLEGLEHTSSVGDTQAGTDILGDALYDILVAFGPDLFTLLGASPESAGALDLADGLLIAVEADEALRDKIVSLAVTFLAPERVRPLLEGLSVLLEAGALTEIAGFLSASDCSDASTQLSGAIEASLGVGAP